MANKGEEVSPFNQQLQGKLGVPLPVFNDKFLVTRAMRLYVETKRKRVANKVNVTFERVLALGVDGLKLGLPKNLAVTIQPSS